MRIVQIKTTERDGYTALQVTYGHKDAKKLNKPEAGHFAKAGVAPGKRLVELRLDSVDGFEVGQEITVDTSPPAEGRRHRRQPRQGLRRHHEASQLSRARAPATATTSTTGRRAPSVRARSRVGCSRDSAHVGPHGAPAGDHPQPRGRRGRRRAQRAAREGLGPRPERWRRHRAQRRQGRSRRPDPMAQITLKTPPAAMPAPSTSTTPCSASSRTCPVMHQVVTAQLAASPAGTQSTKTRSEVSRRRRQAVPPEGHRQRPSGLDPGAALLRRWRGPRPEAPLVHQKTPKKMIKPGPALGAVRPRERGQGRRRRRWGWDAPSTKQARRARCARGRGQGARRGRSPPTMPTRR
jgi:hypothetical protein